MAEPNKKEETEEEQEEEINFENPSRPDEYPSSLKSPAIRQGSTYIYKLWKFLLSEWLSKQGCEVYLATPFLDAKRMVDICRIVIDNSDTANIRALYVRNDCHKDWNNQKYIRDIIKTAKENFQEDQRTIIDRKIQSRIYLQGSGKYFHAKFIGCTCGGNAEVLVTSANFTRSHFDIRNHESVLYQEMKEKQFIERFISPLESITVALENSQEQTR